MELLFHGRSLIKSASLQYNRTLKYQHDGKYYEGMVIQVYIPVYFRDKEPPIVSYEYTSTVASKLFNFSPALSNLNVSEYFSNPQTCQCKEFKFCYEPHGHVITGDLRVIENAKLRELVAKGPKYREPNRVNWKATETMFLESIDLYAKN